MNSASSLGYGLIDPRPIAAEAPYTFFLPSETEIVSISAGDFAKLMFEHVPPVQEWGVERMWVLVEGKDGDAMWGKLANNPCEPNAQVSEGEQVCFAPYHVISIRWSNAETGAPRPVNHREYWERCLVDECVLNGTEPVEFIYREEPDMQGEFDTYPDSGWRIRGRAGNATGEEIDARTPRYVAIGAVLNKDDSWLHLIEAPVGSRFMRDFAADVYVVAAS